MATEHEVLLAAAVRAARAAGEAILEIYRTDFDVATKSDQSPVTLADERAEAVIVPLLAAAAPGVPIVAEEAVSAGQVPALDGGAFWLVDPLDGTKEFIGRNGQFTVNIALIEHGRPTLGVVYAPALGRMFSGWVGHGAWLAEDGEGGSGQRSIRCRELPAQGLTVVASRSHGDVAALDAFLAGLPVAGTVNVGSSLKLCQVAAGEADLYPRLGRTMEWDIAAGHAVLAAAGGAVQALGGRPLGYGKAGFENPHFVAGSMGALQALGAVRRGG